ncbi:hypothetical protein JOD43_003365 [Pullulanibacillus pueri]|uniref:DUF4179 domain-containing protein n=1 Tax=Pullulanibacillus pueri TaxID=1437324 RepID=A0A8J2ZXQ3_9BACL|nr:DUF4179 domain-containing protein [Pullulanibacillus pueri]MBM7683186.1 hypothetical protein [Pullulanibacillus pueri]GGH85633.1 hypothetical protein GCM10007096_31480 [Pullulanibacillus pueri]
MRNRGGGKKQWREAEIFWKEIDIPPAAHHRIKEGVQSAARARKHWNAFKFCGLSLTAIVLTLILLVNVSSSFNRMTANVPILSDVVELLKFAKNDEGLESAIKEGDVQAIHTKDTHNGVTLEITHAVADQHRVVLFYTLSTEKRYKFLGLENIQLLNANHEALPAANESSGPQPVVKGKVKGKLQFDLDKGGNISSPLILSAKVNSSNQASDIDINTSNQKNSTLSHAQEKAHDYFGVPVKSVEGIWEIRIPLDMTKVNAKQMYSINKWETIGGQRLYFKDAIFYPTGAEVHLEASPNNSKTILNFFDVKLFDGNRAVNMEHYFEDNEEVTLFFEKSSFDKLKAPKLVVKKLEAIEKKDSHIVVNVKKKTLVKAPLGVSLNRIENVKNSIKITFKMDRALKEKSEGEMIGLLSGSFTDSTGKEYSAGDDTGDLIETTSNTVSITIKKHDYKGPLSFEIADYPSYIQGNIKIPLNK